jgi:hypothetical protein
LPLFNGNENTQDMEATRKKRQAKEDHDTTMYTFQQGKVTVKKRAWLLLDPMDQEV